MNNFHRNLLVVLALGLCVLCAGQWYSQSVQRDELLHLGQVLQQKSNDLQECTNSLVMLNHQVAQMDAGIAELRGSAKTNEDLVLAQRREISRLQSVNESLTGQVAQYQKGVETLQTKLKAAYDGIQQQNSSIQELVTQRTGLVEKLNRSVQERNDIVAKYNQLAAQVEKLNSGKP